MTDDFHEYFMKMALCEAQRAIEEDEVPAGCVIIELSQQEFKKHPMNPEEVRILARTHNRTEGSHDPTAHAEIQAIREACKQRGDFRLTDTVLYVTKEPCAMCAGAIVLARIPFVVWGVSDAKRGGESSFGILSSEALIHRANLTREVCGEEAKAQLQGFFRARR